MAFTLTDQHRVASFDYRRWYSPFTHFRSKCRLVTLVYKLAFINITVVMPTFSDESNRSRIAIVIIIIIIIIIINAKIKVTLNRNVAGALYNKKV